MRRVLSRLAHVQGDLATARRLIEQALALGREIGSAPEVSIALAELADVVLEQGEHEPARRLLAEARQRTSAGDVAQQTARALRDLSLTVGDHATPRAP